MTPSIRVAWVLVVLGLACVVAVAQDPGVRWDFETGDLQGWQVISGNLGPLPSDNDNDRWGGNFGKQGRWFLGTYEGVGDEPQGELRSPKFIISADKMFLLVGGGNFRDETFVALVLADGDREVCRATGRNREVMDPVVWDVSAYKGQRAYVRVVDRRSGGWGHINVDDVRELSPADIAELERQERERREAAERRYQGWKQSVLGPSGRIVYRSEQLRNLTFHMGGIGAGSIALCGDGALRRWQIVNQVNPGAVVPGSFLAVRAQAPGQRPVARVLQTAPVDDLPAVTSMEFIGEYPIAQVNYTDEALPVQVTLQAFSPLIPLNARDSGLPAICFILQAHNPGEAPVQVSFMMTLQNCVGWDGFSTIQGVKASGYGGNENHIQRQGNRVSVLMARPDMDAADKHYGTLALCCVNSHATATPRWHDSAALWADFTAEGALEGNGSSGPSESGSTHNGAVACSLSVSAGQTVEVPFIVAWHFPNRFADYDQNLAGYRLGNMYNNWFAGAPDVAAYVSEHLARLRSETELFRDTFYDSNLPYWLLDCVSSHISTLCSQTCLWIEDGSFHGFEGCGVSSGCCPMNCTHVWNYEQTLAHLFPELERNMRHTDLFIQQDASGFVHHRTVLPLSLPRSSGPFADGHLSTISKAYREHRMSADDSWLRQAWPRIRSAMEWAITAYDPDGDGVVQVEQWNTYDCSVWGANTFIGSQWLAALRAAEKMATLMGEPQTAARYRALADAGAAKMDTELWNGEWWIQDVDLVQHPATQYATGCHSDQLLGQWWAHLNGLGYVLPADHVRTALRSIFSYNFMKSFQDFTQSPRVFASPDEMGLLNCTWPRGGRPDPVTYYSDEVWTGIEYEVAALMILEGMWEEGYQLVKAARDRYNGTRRSPWNEIECGDHYARAMSSYSLLLAAEGLYYDGPAGLISFAPRVQPDHLRAFFTGAEGWGTFEQWRSEGAQVDRLRLAYGTLTLRRLALEVPAALAEAEPQVTVSLGEQVLPVETSWEGTRLVISFPDGITLRAGDTLTSVAQPTR